MRGAVRRRTRQACLCLFVIRPSSQSSWPSSGRASLRRRRLKRSSRLPHSTLQTRQGAQPNMQLGARTERSVRAAEHAKVGQVFQGVMKGAVGALEVVCGQVLRAPSPPLFLIPPPPSLANITVLLASPCPLHLVQCWVGALRTEPPALGGCLCA